MSQYIRNEGGFFSDYYLTELLQSRHKGKLGEATRHSAWRKLSNRWRKATRSLGTSSSEAKTRSLWLKPLFEELGFILDKGPSFYDDTYSKEKISSSHLFKPETSDVPLVYVDIHPWGQDLDSPLPREKRRNTPHRKMERLLDQGEARWGIITNGREIRLLQREQVGGGRRYFEVYLDNLFEDENENSFVVFWALFRAEAFIPDNEGVCLIDKISKGCQHYAVRVSDELRDNVRAALEHLVKGIIKDESNRSVLKNVSANDLFEQGLIFLYRILFVLYAESRELLPIGNRIYRESYSLEALRDYVDDPRNEFKLGEYWIQKSLEALFKMIREGVAAGDIMVPAYDGGLFTEKTVPLLDKCRISDSCLADVIRTISVTTPQKKIGRERIAYRELGIEQLGAIYEGLLQYEPRIAEQEMAVIKKEETILPLSSVPEEKVLEMIPVGSFYLATWGGSRKQSGTYNTPLKITQWLVRQALDPLIKGKSSEEILQLNVLDPSMGSGAFLVSACYFLADAYAEALVAEGKEISERIDEEAKADFRRLVAEHCLYGVDFNPLAVELAKVSLWLTTIAKGKPLTFLDQNLVCGDSIIGARLENLGNYPRLDTGKKAPKEQSKKNLSSKQLSLYEVGVFGPGLTSLAKDFETLEGIPDDTLEMIEHKAYLFEQDRKEDSFYAQCKLACDLWCSLWFWPEGKELPNELEYGQLLHKIFNGSCTLPEEKMKTYFEIVKKVARERHFLHWELEFPAIFFDVQGRKKNFGFDAVFGNPPWELVLPNSKEFFSAFDPHFRKLEKQEAEDRINELCKNESISKAWNEYKLTIERKNRYFQLSEFFNYQGKGHINFYKLFLERFFTHAKDGGCIAVIVPSGISTDIGSQPLRELLFKKSEVKAWYTFENKNKIFPIHSSFKFVLLVTQIGSETEKLPCGFYLHDLSILDQIEKVKLIVKKEDIIKFSPATFSIMEFRCQKDIDLTSKIYDKHPLLREYLPDSWNISLIREFNSTDDNSLFGADKSDWPLRSGKTFHQFQHDFAPPEFFIPEKKGLDRLLSRYISKKKSINKEDLNIEKLQLPPKQFRLAFRKVASSTNERTMISAILPPNSFLDDSAAFFYSKLRIKDFPYPVPLKVMCYLCGVLNSFTIDFIIRCKVSSDVSYFYVKQLPIPRLQDGNFFFEEIGKRVARLTATSKEYEKFAEEISIELGSLGERERLEINAEIDAIVALLYGLDMADLEHILSTFPIVSDQQKRLTIEKFLQFSELNLIKTKSIVRDEK